jgi:hypothetical protein
MIGPMLAPIDPGVPLPVQNISGIATVIYRRTGYVRKSISAMHTRHFALGSIGKRIHGFDGPNSSLYDLEVEGAELCDPHSPIMFVDNVISIVSAYSSNRLLDSLCSIYWNS